MNSKTWKSIKTDEIDMSVNWHSLRSCVKSCGSNANAYAPHLSGSNILHTHIYLGDNQI